MVETMSFTEFMEPIDVCVDSRGSFGVTTPTGPSPITCVCVGLNDDILVGTCTALMLYDGGGRYLRKISLSPPGQNNRLMTLACAICPQTGNIVSAVVDPRKNRSYLTVSQYKGNFLFSLDSHGSRLKRPCGVCIATTSKWNGMCFVVDSATHSVKAFQYK
ncbi:unnamed protein product [Gongylonema pulchrum]|uniref:Tripartite motif-containing protein 3 n=1 Tax=Gongylonema pulchrum TaxID=637853 RepID=A0A183DVW8_9BILA|nr:unnamed protein product [Gongylonema pulchrum]